MNMKLIRQAWKTQLDQIARANIEKKQYGYWSHCITRGCREFFPSAASKLRCEKCRKKIQAKRRRSMRIQGMLYSRGLKSILWGGLGK